MTDSPRDTTGDTDRKGPRREGRQEEPVNEDEALTLAAEAFGRRYGMTAAQVLLQVAIGDIPHPDAPADVCGATDPRQDDRWCALAPQHPGEGHNRYAPRDGCRTWLEHDAHAERVDRRTTT